MSETTFIPRRRARDIQFYALEDPNSSLIVNEGQKGGRANNSEIYTPYYAVKFMWDSAVYSCMKKRFNMVIDDKECEDRVRQGRYEPNIDYHIASVVKTCEPCCGHGNFLEYIIRQKFKYMAWSFRQAGLDLKKLRGTSLPFLMMLNVLGSLNAIDILADNVIISRNRIFLWTNKVFKKFYGRKMPLSLSRIIAYLLRMTIIHSDFLFGEHPFFFMRVDENRYVYYWFFRAGMVHQHWEFWDTRKKWIIQKPSEVCVSIKAYFEKEKSEKKRKEFLNKLPLEYSMMNLDNPPPDEELLPFRKTFENMALIYKDFKEAWNSIDRTNTLASIANLDKNLSRTIVR